MVCTGVPCKPTTTPLLNMSTVPITKMKTTMSATVTSTSTPVLEENCTYGWTEWLLVPKNYKITLDRNQAIAMVRTVFAKVHNVVFFHFSCKTFP